MQQVFLKNNMREARGLKTLCLYLMVWGTLVGGGVMVGASGAYAQSNDMLNRLNRLETEIDTLNRAVYKGEAPPPSSSRAPVYSTNNNSIISNDATARMEIRLQQMETQLRELTGKIEQQNFDTRQLKEQIEAMKTQANSAARGASQIAVPEREEAARESSLMAPAPNANENPLNLQYKPPEPSGIQTTRSKGNNVMGGGDATAQYEQAFAHLRANNYEEAQEGFAEFLSQHDDHVLAANAKYWLGETYYVRGDYTKAAKEFAEGFQKFPDSAKSPDILLKLGMSLQGMDKTREACIALNQVSIKFPTGADQIVRRAEQEIENLGCAAEG